MIAGFLRLTGTITIDRKCNHDITSMEWAKKQAGNFIVDGYLFRQRIRCNLSSIGGTSSDKIYIVRGTEVRLCIVEHCLYGVLTGEISDEII
ncbi:MAG: hypothetical protein ICPDIFCJ_00643 [Sodalis sp. Ppy]|nr:hypothetical protein [Sodalis sp. Ppy]